MTGAHHAVGQPFSEFIDMLFPSALFEPCVKLLQVVLRQLVQRDAADGRDDVRINPPRIARLCGRAELRSGIILIPEVNPVAERHVRLNFLAPPSAFLPQFRQLFLTLGLGVCRYIFRFGVAVFLIPDDNSAFPPPVLALKDTAVALLFLCHLLVLQFQFFDHAADNRGGVFLHVTRHVRIGVKREARVCVSENP